MSDQPQAPGVFNFKSPQEAIDFLQQQLAAAVALLASRAATREECMAEVRANYAPALERQQAALANRERSLKELMLRAGQDVRRYKLLRTVRVRAPHLGINGAKGESLDHLLDLELARHPKAELPLAAGRSVLS